MKPVIVLPPDCMAEGDVAELRANGFCVVVAMHPEKVRFMDPAPADRTQVERAAIMLSRKLLSGVHPESGRSWTADTIGAFSTLFTRILMDGTPLDPKGTRAEQEQKAIDEARMDELTKIGREEAREERAEKKRAMASKKAEVVKT